MIKFRRKQSYKVILTFLVIVISITEISMFILYIQEITLTLILYESMFIITIFILFRIGITIGMAFIIFKQWFRQEKIYYMDILFLSGLFFLGLSFGKSLDLLYKLIYFTSNDVDKLKVLKARYLLIIFTSAPLILIGIDLILFSLKENYEKLANEKKRNIVSLVILAMIIVLQSIPVVIAQNITELQYILIILHVPSLIWIFFTFLYANKNKRFNQVKPLIIAIAFLIDLILYISSIITMPLRQSAIGFSAFYMIIAESVDLIIIIIIFFGFYKASYEINNKNIK